MAGIATRVTLQVILVLRLRLPERTGRSYFCYHLSKAERTSVRIIPCELSRNSLTLAGSIGFVKLGQPNRTPIRTCRGRIAKS